VTRGGEDPAKEPWTVDYGRVTPLLTRAIQDVNGIVEKQQEEINVLKKRLKVLEAENARSSGSRSRIRESVSRR
jgi:hypothetical protein